jgi:hypothetical protein
MRIDYASRSLAVSCLVALVGACGGGGGGGSTTAPSPGTLQFSASSYSVNEASGTVTITVTRTGGSAGAVAVSYATGNGPPSGGAVAPGDYTAKSGTLNWADGDGTTRSFDVQVVDDGSAEGPETVALALSNPTGSATLGTNANATLVIDDTPGTILFTQTTFTVLENAGTARVTVSRQGGSNGTVSVDFTTANAAPDCPDPINQPETCEIASRRIAKPTLDYTPTDGTLTFLNGEISKDIEIPITFPDPNPPEATQPEPGETLDIALCQATGTNVGNNVRAVLTIADFQASASPGIVLSPTANNRPGDVPINIRPEITLSVLVDQASLTPTSAKVRCDTGSGTVEIPSALAIFDPDETTVTIVPQSALPSAGAACVAVLTSAVKDSSGVPITATELESSSFTTGSTTDTTRPTVTDPSPPPDTTGVNPDTAVIGATINDYMLNTLSINPRNIQLSYNDGTVERIVAGTVNFVPDINLPSGGNIALPVTFKPACPLRSNTEYTVRFKGEGVNKPIRDVVGNALAADEVWSFTTGP